MKLIVRLALFVCALSGLTFAAPRLDYGRDIRPILAENCFHCHGQDSQKRMANLRLDTFEGAVASHNGRAAVVPGKPELSALFQRITTDQKPRLMPPASSNRHLTPQQVATLKTWIEEGGTYSQHWAFTPPLRPALPQSAEPISYLTTQRLAALGLHLNKPATPATWLRRVSLDLTGLTPTPAEIDSFLAKLASQGELAYTAAVDSLLTSPRYGERMATDWLDVARYADTHGFNNDSSRSMWRWRDWVIASFNSNLPYDRFLTEQLAGDLLPNPTLDQRIATGFGRNHVINSEGGIIDEEYRVEYVADRVRTLGMSSLGLTLECARCHDHKYDPIAQRDYYRFFAFFNNVPEMGEDGRVANAVPMIPAPSPSQQMKLKELEGSIAKWTRLVQDRQKSWRWHGSNLKQTIALAHQASVPTGAAFHLDCEAASVFKLSQGIVGNACSVGTTKPMTTAVGISRRNPLTFSAWLEPGQSDKDAPLLSAIDYSRNPASVGYGGGMEFRLVDGELEFRSGQRFPAYSIRVRSVGAGLSPGQWRHLTLVYEGAPVESAGRAEARWVRIFVDGRELPIDVVNDGATLPDAKSDKPAPTLFRIGWDNNPKPLAFTGRLDELSLWTRALTASERNNLFVGQALPYAAGREQRNQASTVEAAWLRDTMLRQHDSKFARDSDELNAARAQWLALQRELPTVMVMQELATPRQTHLLRRGAYDQPGEKVEPGVPEQLLGAWPQGAPKNRLGLAQWLTQPDHPLTARVTVNRFWQQFFGQGLVKTSENFGVQGESPSHPELLDWLARDFIESGWDVKALLKRIVLSPVYRQDASASPDLLARDPENRLLARGPRFRLPAEVIRDQALQISGLLTERIGGPSVFPYQPAGLYQGIVVAADYPGTRYVESQGPDLYRRSMYTFWKRTVPHPTLTVFDAPDREFCIVRRSNTNTPLQALTLLNDPIFIEAARALAQRAIQEGGSTPESRLTFAFRLATGHPPDNQELGILLKTLDSMRTRYSGDENAARQLIAVGASPANKSIPVDELAAYTAVMNLILNLDEVITKG